MSLSPWFSLHIPGSFPFILQLVYSLSKDTGQTPPSPHPFFLVLIFIAVGGFTSQYTQRCVCGGGVQLPMFVLSCHLYCSCLELVEKFISVLDFDAG